MLDAPVVIKPKVEKFHKQYTSLEAKGRKAAPPFLPSRGCLDMKLYFVAVVSLLLCASIPTRVTACTGEFPGNTYPLLAVPISEESLANGSSVHTR